MSNYVRQDWNDVMRRVNSLTTDEEKCKYLRMTVEKDREHIKMHGLKAGEISLEEKMNAAVAAGELTPAQVPSWAARGSGIQGGGVINWVKVEVEKIMSEANRLDSASRKLTFLSETLPKVKPDVTYKIEQEIGAIQDEILRQALSLVDGSQPMAPGILKLQSIYTEFMEESFRFNLIHDNKFIPNPFERLTSKLDLLLKRLRIEPSKIEAESEIESDQESHAGNRLRWLGTDQQFAYLIHLLQQAIFIQGGRQWKEAANSFVRADGTPFESKRLRETASKLGFKNGGAPSTRAEELEGIKDEISKMTQRPTLP